MAEHISALNLSFMNLSNLEQIHLNKASGPFLYIKWGNERLAFASMWAPSSSLVFPKGPQFYLSHGNILESYFPRSESSCGI